MSKKKPTSPTACGRRPKAPPRRGVRHIVFDRDKHDNKPIKVFCSFRENDEHFKALRAVCRYLRATKHWSLIYQRPVPLADHPDVAFPYVPEDPTLLPFPDILRDELIGFLDAAHATAHLRRSITGLAIYFCGAAIAWKSRVQLVTATSSTEAEFYAAVACAKIVKFLRYVLQELEE